MSFSVSAKEPMEEFLTTEIILIALVMVAIVIVFFFTMVANKMSSIDHRMTEISDGMDQRVQQSISALSDQLHDDVLMRNKATEESLAQMGDSWRNTLNKTVTDVRSEIGRLQGEISSSSKNLHETLVSNMTDHATEVNKHLATVRDNNHSEMHNYQEQLFKQMQQHAASEQDTINQSLNSITSAVKDNLTTLATDQSKTLLDVTGKYSEGYSQLSERLDDTIEKASSKVTKDLSSISKKVNTTIKSFDRVVQDDLQSINEQVSDNLSNITSKLDTSVVSISNDVNTNLNQLSSNVNEKILGSIEKLDKEMGDTSSKLDAEMSAITGKLDTEMTNVGNKLGTGIDGINESMREGIDQLGRNFTVNFDAVEEKINNRLHREMQGLLDVFHGFAERVHAIETTQDRIEQLAGNVAVLSQTLDDRRARGSLGEVMVESLVSDNLAPKDYELNAELSNGEVVDCLLRLPKPSGNVAISTKIDISDLEDIYSDAAKESERKKARKQFATKLSRAIRKTSERCIIKDETAEGAILLLPSESAFSEIQMNHRNLVDDAYKSRVWLASPSTLIAMTTVARSVIKDANARKEIEVLRDEMAEIVREFTRVGNEVHNLNNDVDQIYENMHSARKSVRKFGTHLSEINERLIESKELKAHIE